MKTNIGSAKAWVLPHGVRFALFCYSVDFDSLFALIQMVLI